MTTTQDLIESTADPASILGATLRGLGAGLQVRHIATFEIKHCALDVRVADIESDPDLSVFDYVPVMHEGRYFGVLHRLEAAAEGTVEAEMEHFHQGMLVAADMPILEFMGEMGGMPYRLVVDGTRINGFVTRSDLLKLPVRVCVFALITHLEMVMSDLISTAYPKEDAWLGVLTPGRAENVEKRMDGLKKDKLDRSLLSCTEFCDKRDIILAHLKVNAPVGPEVKRFKRSLESIEDVRNALAHAVEYAQNLEKLAIFLAAVKEAQIQIIFLEARIRQLNSAPS